MFTSLVPGKLYDCPRIIEVIMYAMGKINWQQTVTKHKYVYIPWDVIYILLHYKFLLILLMSRRKITGLGLHFYINLYTNICIV